MLPRALILTVLLAVFTTALHANSIPIIGQVLGTNDQPKAKAIVTLEPIPSVYERARLRLELQPGPEAIQSTKTAADGTFELAAPAEGMWKVVVTAAGFLTSEFRLVPLVDAAVLPLLQLQPATELDVTILGPEKTPVSGVIGAVTLNVRNGSWRPQLRLARADGGSNGLATVPIARGEKIQLEVLADGFPLRTFEVMDESSIEIELEAGVERTVRVMDRQYRALGEVVVFQGSALLPHGLTDDEGLLSVVIATQAQPAMKVVGENRWHGTFGLEAGPGPNDLVKDEVRDKIEIEPSIEEWVLDPPMTVRGRVLDVTSRDPVPAALVWGVRGEFVSTDERGLYSLDMGIYTSRSMRAAAVGYIAGYSQLRQVESGANDAPTIALAPAASLSGRVVDAEGRLLEGVAIALSVSRAGGLSSGAWRLNRNGWRGRTTARGVFEMSGLPAGVGFELRLVAAGFAPQTVAVEPLEPSERRTGIEAALAPGRLSFGSGP